VAVSGGPGTSWITAADLAGRHDLTDQTVDSGVLTEAATTASNLLYVLSGRQFPGLCTATIRPTSGGSYGRWPLVRMHAAGIPIDSMMAATNGGVDNAIRLGMYPIRAITQIKIDGVVLSSTKYRVDENRYLVRVDGQPWPAWQRTDLPDTQPGTFSVALTYGADPPSAGVNAAAALGAELAKSKAGLPNRLPVRVQSITRQQVSMAILDPMAFLDKGMTGILEADLFIEAYNPTRQRRRPGVWSPDMQSHRRTG
jgi:hypothetical protein